MAKILECLAAEPAGPAEIAEYLGDATDKQVRSLLDIMKGKGLVRRLERNRWWLQSPETEALVYGDE